MEQPGGGEPEVEPIPEAEPVPEAEPLLEPDPVPEAPQIYLTHRQLTRFTEMQLGRGSWDGFYVIPGAIPERNTVEEVCPRLVPNCICRSMMFCQFDAVDFEFGRLRWSCGRCKRWLTSTHDWRQIRRWHFVNRRALCGMLDAQRLLQY